MNRRAFLKKASIGAAVIAATPSLLASLPASHIPLTATVTEYSDYVTASYLLEECALAVGRNAALSIDRLVLKEFNAKAK